MTNISCPGRPRFEEETLLTSQKNTCPFGLDVECSACVFYKEQ